MKKMNRDEIQKLHQHISDGIYQKYGKVIVRPAEKDETIITTIDGQIETIKTASPTDVVIRNITIDSSGETYIIGWDKYQDRYDYAEGPSLKIDGLWWKPAVPVGRVIGGFYKGEDVHFAAPWGEDMVLKDGDFLASPYPVDDPTDVYRIAKKEFHQTYRLDAHD